MKKKTAKKSAKTKGKKRYSCSVCGLVVSIDEACGCIDACDIVCCGEQMKQR